MPFTTPEDIANRALQHVGSPRITSFTDDSKEAAEIAFAYDKVRRAILQENLWVFAIRRATLYPVEQPLAPDLTPTAPDTTVATMPSMLIEFPAWDATVSYPFASVVVYGGTKWENIFPSNLNNTPGVSAGFWQTYAGVNAAQPYDTSGTTGYNTGDVVYETLGAGAVDVYRSIVNGNTIDPSASTTWSADVAYRQGAVVTDGSFFFRSVFELNQNNQPGVYGPWNSSNTYAAGALVGGSNGLLYASIAGGNTNHNPVSTTGYWTATGSRIGAYPMWNNAVTYPQNFLVADINGGVYISLAAGNTGNQPSTATTWWAFTGKLNPWSPSFASATASDQWVNLDASLTAMEITYPLGSGPLSQNRFRNVFLLPNAYLRHAPQDPKAGANSFLGAPTGAWNTDWVFEGNYVVSSQTSPIVMRFVADITSVVTMDDMFCEAFAARLGVAVCEVLTQSSEKLKTCWNIYKSVVSDAKRINGIEAGPEEPPVDDYIATRI